ncbi:amphi-Trp domain-containing protein [Nocardia sp. PE-7]|uniref:amphi-Trp domain-containing protein n=1 Tax=Nocardia sp. PE-7 TaxID=3058426 RepID=UPI0026596C55|nr:amphi-Trp domain-containing protein [Nocardia sp. PE-7]WKG11014.1 amphi-Trp domain-containing protein [Nocardia sp. PE-7]
MPKLEIKRKSELSRKEVGERLITIGRAIAHGSEVEFETGGDSIEIVVADRVRWELEIEVDGDETEIEIEIKWRDDPATEPAPAAPKSAPRTATKSAATKSTPAKPARRTRARKTTAK